MYAIRSYYVDKIVRVPYVGVDKENLSQFK